MKPMELTITNIDTSTPPEGIKFNYDELKKGLQVQLKKYQGLVVTENEVTDAKRTLANLRKLRTAIEDKRKEVKAYWNQPYDEFADKIKELTGLIDEPIGVIDTQVKDYDERRREEKIAGAQDYFVSQIKDTDLEGKLKWHLVEDKRFGNVSMSEQAIKDQIDETISKAKDGLQTIQKMTSDYKFEMAEKYLEKLSLPEAISEGSRLEQQALRKEEEAKEQERLQAERRAQKETVQEAVKPPTETFIPIPITPNDTLKAEEHQQANTATEETFTIRFEVSGTKQQLLGLSQFMRDNNIDFSQIK